MTARKRFCEYAMSAGPAYDYLAVPPNVFEDFLAAESKGRFVNWQIKPYYRFMRGG